MRSEDPILLTHHQSFFGEGQPVAISVTGSTIGYWHVFIQQMHTAQLTVPGNFSDQKAKQNKTKNKDYIKEFTYW